jgi:hypothetical protein
MHMNKLVSAALGLTALMSLSGAAFAVDPAVPPAKTIAPQPVAPKPAAPKTTALPPPLSQQQKQNVQLQAEAVRQKMLQTQKQDPIAKGGKQTAGPSQQLKSDILKSATKITDDVNKRKALQTQPAPPPTLSQQQQLGVMGIEGANPTMKMTQEQLQQLKAETAKRKIDRTTYVDPASAKQPVPDAQALQDATSKKNEAEKIMDDFVKKMSDERGSIVGNMR